MIATTEQYAGMLDAASAGGYALPAVNVTSSEAGSGQSASSMSMTM
jgi:hypothetical protein